MPANSKALTTGNELYPIRDNPEATQTIRLISDNAERDIVGKIVLRQKLTPDQTKLIAARRMELEAGLIRGRQRDIEDEMLRLIVGFDQFMDASEAQIVAAQYTSVLLDANLPLFAIKRACMRWQSGSVTEEEIGQPVRRGKRPAVDLVCIVARNIAQPYRTEFSIAAAILGAPTEKQHAPATDEDRARVAKVLEETSEAMKATDARLNREAADRREQNEKWIRQKAEDHLIEAYTSLGLEPVRINGTGDVVSLPLLMAQGWKLKQTGKKVSLVKPR